MKSDFDVIPLTTNEKASSPANPLLAFALSGRSATKPLSDWHAILPDGEQRIVEKKAWNYIVDNIATNAVNNAYSSSGDPFAPWSPRRSLGGSLGFGIGTGISQGIMVGTQLRRMKPDIERVIQNNCPAGYSRPSTNTLEAFDKSSSSYCNWNPWEAACKDVSLQRSKAQESCLQALIKYECKYTKYLEANPHMKDWVKANPEMARKEALRLKAIDAN